MIDVLNTNTDFLNALIAGNRSKSSDIALEYFRNSNSVQDLYENILRNSLYEVGELWETNKISVATEHLASAIVDSILSKVYSNFSYSKTRTKNVVVSCAENEFHQIGIKMISDIFEINGWNSHFLGTNTSTDKLINQIKTIEPDLLAISLSIYFHLPTLGIMIQKIRNEFPDLTILVGGQAFRQGGYELLMNYEKVIYKADIKSLEQFIKILN